MTLWTVCSVVSSQKKRATNMQLKYILLRNKDYKTQEQRKTITKQTIKTHFWHFFFIRNNKFTLINTQVETIIHHNSCSYLTLICVPNVKRLFVIQFRSIKIWILTRSRSTSFQFWILVRKMLYRKVMKKSFECNSISFITNYIITSL